MLIQLVRGNKKLQTAGFRYTPTPPLREHASSMHPLPPHWRLTSFVGERVHQGWNHQGQSNIAPPLKKLKVEIAGCQPKTFKTFILMVKPLKPLFFSEKPLFSGKAGVFFSVFRVPRSYKILYFQWCPILSYILSICLFFREFRCNTGKILSVLYVCTMMCGLYTQGST